MQGSVRINGLQVIQGQVSFDAAGATRLVDQVGQVDRTGDANASMRSIGDGHHLQVQVRSSARFEHVQPKGIHPSAGAQSQVALQSNDRVTLLHVLHTQHVVDPPHREDDQCERERFHSLHQCQDVEEGRHHVC